jgi:general secretion pathway protein L
VNLLLVKTRALERAGYDWMQSITAIAEALKRGAAGFLHWWRGELWELLPAPARERLAGRGGRIIVAAATEGYRVFEEASGSANSHAVLSQAEVLAAVARHVRARPQLRVGIRIPAQSCFQRTLELPIAARADVARILDLDLERSTPFKVKDVYTGYLVEAGAPGSGRIKVRQFVTKRPAIDQILEPLETSGLAVDFADCWAKDISAPLPVDFLRTVDARLGPRERRLTAPLVLTATAGLLAVSAVVQGLWRSHAALDDLQTRVGSARAEAAVVRRALEGSDAVMGELASLQRLKMTQMPVVLMIGELSKLLPDTVWVTELRLEGDVLDISGLAKSGASLLSLFEGSRLFSDAALTAPLTLDQQEDKERFSLRVRLRPQLLGEPVPVGETR